MYRCCMGGSRHHASKQGSITTLAAAWPGVARHALKESNTLLASMLMLAHRTAAELKALPQGARLALNMRKGFATTA